jgi:methyltransferase-like protein
MLSKKEKYILRDNLQRAVSIKYLHSNRLKSSLLKNNKLNGLKKKNYKSKFTKKLKVRKKKKYVPIKWRK